jgi:hypothetical protein
MGCGCCCEIDIDYENCRHEKRKVIVDLGLEMCCECGLILTDVNKSMNQEVGNENLPKVQIC